ncbi:MAG: type I-D CRISPR-associated protein Cas5/Csc1 [Pseudanabaenaceae cyanobacterium SKYGB_i_bin29]|nr:type I-D CRISPR-associated protein Cas5/Csc1 [Pseudanabaenaceae cyanobacterium SKYG29]MDW8420995.1 type I-D CRISPR-associated protein Cas5/Csc1 [Pseudanabaenaceae cyanobacterium SKYGB_i_bin29]
MRLYFCRLILHDNVFFATREMGELYETGNYLHNWALSYAFFADEFISSPYSCLGESAQTPSYLKNVRERSLLALNQEGIYLFPGKPILWSYQINTFKAAQTNYYAKVEKFGEGSASKNYPANIGRAKELAIGSIYHSFLVIEEDKKLPSFIARKAEQIWIRLGKWSSKVKVEVVPITNFRQKTGRFICHHPVNPLDLGPRVRVLLYDRVVMCPCSLLSTAEMEGEYWEINSNVFSPEPVFLPCHVGYGYGGTE